MSADQLTCPECNSPVSDQLNLCSNCGARLNIGFSRTEPTYFSPNYPDDLAVKIRNPNQQSLVALGVMTGLLLWPVLALLGIVVGGYAEIFLIIPTIVLAGLLILFAIAWAVSWLAGKRRIRQIRAFLTSTRPLLRWTYTPEEWRELKEAGWQDTKGDWMTQLGCLTFLFGLIGLLIGAMIGGDEGLEEMRDSPS